MTTTPRFIGKKVLCCGRAASELHIASQLWDQMVAMPAGAAKETARHTLLGAFDEAAAVLAKANESAQRSIDGESP